MATGPLIPGLKEYDRPRRGFPRWLAWLIGSVVVVLAVVVLAGFAGGVGPLRALGQSTVPLEAVGYRLTADDTVIEVAVTLPASGLCREDELRGIAFERSNRIEVDTSVTRSRNPSCPITSLGGDVRWVVVPLDAPIGTRTVVRAADRQAVPLAG
jgi:hypothetical protein